MIAIKFICYRFRMQFVDKLFFINFIPTNLFFMVKIIWSISIDIGNKLTNTNDWGCNEIDFFLNLYCLQFRSYSPDLLDSNIYFSDSEAADPIERVQTSIYNFHHFMIKSWIQINCVHFHCSYMNSCRSICMHFISIRQWLSPTCRWFVQQTFTEYDFYVKCQCVRWNVSIIKKGERLSVLFIGLLS